MSDREIPDEVIETDDGVARVADAELVESTDELDEPADERADQDDADHDDADHDDAGPEHEPAEDESLGEGNVEPEDGVGDEHDEQGGDALVSRLRLIGQQPLAERASSLNQLHDELREKLESGDPTRR